MSGPVIVTVGGEVDATEVGIVLPHEHIVANLYRVTGNPDHLLNDPVLAQLELAEFRKAGGSLLVDCTSLGLGRDPNVIAQASVETGLHIVMGCGWYRQSYYDSSIERSTVRELGEQMIRDCTDGVGPAKRRAGIIGEVGSDLDYIAPAE